MTATGPLPFHYLISGLHVASEFALPPAIVAPSGTADPDLFLRVGPVAEHLPAPTRSARHWERAGDDFLLKIPGVARFAVNAGREIVVAADPAADPGDVTLYLLGTCFAVVLQQRGRLVLHASAVVAGGRARLFCGDSGAGKSTLAAMLAARSYPLLNDDVCSLTPAADGSFTVLPDGRMLKLWGSALTFLDLGDRRGPSVRADTDKFYLAPPATEQVACPVGALYVLTECPADERPSIQPLSPLDCVLELRRQAYRPALVEVLDQDASFFAASTRLLATAGVFRLRRPKSFARADEVLDLLESHWGSLPVPAVEPTA